MGRSREDLLQRLLETFAEEAAEHIRMLEADLAALAELKVPDDRAGIAESGFRTVHTLKGAARAVGLRNIEAFCQEVEHFLSKRARGKRPFTDPDVALFGRVVATVDGLVARRMDPKEVQELQDQLAVDEEPVDLPIAPVESGQDEPPDILAQDQQPDPPQAAAALGPAAPAAMRFPEEPVARPRVSELARSASIRVPAARLDALANTAETLLQPVDALLDSIGELRLLSRSLRQRGGPHRTTQETIGELPSTADQANSVRRLLEKVTASQRFMQSNVEGLLDQARDLRMTPLSWVVEAFPGMVADLAKEEGKRVHFTTSGTDISVDRRILEHIKDPLIHLIRNAVSHGIELPDDRVAAGKPETACLALAFSTDDRGWLKVLVKDDGAGVDRARVARLVSERDGLSIAETELSDADLLNALTQSGMSTSKVVTAVSGHGLGMAIVREHVENLDGSLGLSSQLGLGTEFSVEVPTAMSLFVGVHAQNCGKDYLFPIRGVIRVLKVVSSDLKTVRGRAMIALNDDLIPVADLEEALKSVPSSAGPKTDGSRRCVIVQAGERRVGLFVDSVFGRTDVVLRPLEAPLKRVRNVAAAAQLRSGDLALLLRLSDLVQQVDLLGMAPRSKIQDNAPAQVSRTVLVVDDSPTTRVMERNLLEAAGYTVFVASDGIDALETLKHETVDVVVSDIDMPRMNGFELVSRIRDESRFSDLPIILVTVLDTPDDKRRGLEAGASAYMVKAQFDESKLLDLLSRIT